VRLFVALEIPFEIRNALAAFLKELREVAPKVKWIRAENLHVTLKFLGETDAAMVNDIKSVLGSIRITQLATLDFCGIGFFPSETRPRVFWAGIESSANLRALALEIDRELHKFGFPLEDRPFTPHLTLARFNPPGMPLALGAAIKPHASRSFGSLAAREFHLIESKLKSTGAEYTTVQSFPFVTET
jgi:2'-5' RNA ligase